MAKKINKLSLPKRVVPKVTNGLICGIGRQPPRLTIVWFLRRTRAHSESATAAATDAPPTSRSQCVIGCRACDLNSRTMTGSTDTDDLHDLRNRPCFPITEQRAAFDYFDDGWRDQRFPGRVTSSDP